MIIPRPYIAWGADAAVIALAVSCWNAISVRRGASAEIETVAVRIAPQISPAVAQRLAILFVQIVAIANLAALTFVVAAYRAACASINIICSYFLIRAACAYHSARCDPAARVEAICTIYNTIMFFDFGAPVRYAFGKILRLRRRHIVIDRKDDPCRYRDDDSKV
jgi:hypothetical protein